MICGWILAVLVPLIPIAVWYNFRNYSGPALGGEVTGPVHAKHPPDVSMVKLGPKPDMHKWDDSWQTPQKAGYKWR